MTLKILRGKSTLLLLAFLTSFVCEVAATAKTAPDPKLPADKAAKAADRAAKATDKAAAAPDPKAPAPAAGTTSAVTKDKKEASTPAPGTKTADVTNPIGAAVIKETNITLTNVRDDLLKVLESTTNNQLASTEKQLGSSFSEELFTITKAINKFLVDALKQMGAPQMVVDQITKAKDVDKELEDAVVAYLSNKESAEAEAAKKALEEAAARAAALTNEIAQVEARLEALRKELTEAEQKAGQKAGQKANPSKK